jgi:AcrR family transcriptional regulator
MELGLRDRKKVAVRAALVDASLRLFGERGFDAVTVDELAAAADVSRRTFFRYFPTKEAVLFAHREDQLEAFRAALAGNEEAGDAFGAVRTTLLALADDYDRNRAEILAVRAVVRGSPWLVARDLEMDRAFEAVIAEHLVASSRRTAGDRRRARIVAAAVVGAVRVVLEEWAEKDGALDLRKHGQEALDLLEPIAPRAR